MAAAPSPGVAAATEYLSDGRRRLEQHTSLTPCRPRRRGRRQLRRWPRPARLVVQQRPAGRGGRQSERQQAATLRRANPFGRCAHIERHYLEPGLPHLRQRITPGLRPQRGQEPKLRLLRADQFDRLCLLVGPVICTAPVSSRRLSSQVCPTTTNSSAEPLRGDMAGTGQQVFVALLDADRADHGDAQAQPAAATSPASAARSASLSQGVTVQVTPWKITLQPDRHVALGTTTRRAPASTLSRTQPQPGRPDILFDVAANIRVAGLAGVPARLAAIALVSADQGDARADPGIVVHHHVVWHVQRIWQSRAMRDRARRNGAVRRATGLSSRRNASEFGQTDRRCRSAGWETPRSEPSETAAVRPCASVPGVNTIGRRPDAAISGSAPPHAASPRRRAHA